MISIDYLCIDDQQDSTIIPLLQLLGKNGAINFLRSTPRKLEEQLTAIDEFAALGKEHIGLLLDLRLDMEADANGNRVTYRGPTLAQELRTRMAEKVLRPFPIVLWSVNAKFQQSYLGDESSHDLFDDVFGKDNEISEQPAEVSRKLTSLAEGYSRLGKLTSNVLDVLNIGSSSSSIYAQFLAEFFEIAKNSSTHELAQFLLNELIRKEGLLVTEEMLASRLGVDIERSGADWVSLKTQLDLAMYSGPFSEAWTRWWWFQVEDWWAHASKAQPALQRLTASERVSILNSNFTLQLQPARSIQETYSTKFSTLCVGTGRPLDPINGLKVIKRATRNWHDASFVSVYAALQRIGRDKWRLDPLERDRFEKIKAMGSE